MSHNITVEGGTSVRLPTAGKYCDRDIVITATGSGGSEDLDAVLTEQEAKIAELKAILNSKASGGNIDALIDRSIESVRSDVTTIGYYAFASCANLVNINFPNAVTISGYGFQNCTSLKDAFLPKVQGLNGYAFFGCTMLENVDLPSVKSIGNYAFRKCAALKKIDLNQTYNINVYAFYECTNLETIILRKTDKICTLAGVNVLQYTKIADGEGYIYVPSSLYDDYVNGTNWATYKAQFRKIEDYPEICGGE